MHFVAVHFFQISESAQKCGEHLTFDTLEYYPCYCYLCLHPYILSGCKHKSLQNNTTDDIINYYVWQTLHDLNKI